MSPSHSQLIVICIIAECILVTNGKVCDPLNYGAQGNGIIDDTLAIQKAINGCSLINASKGTYNTIMFQSNYSFLSFPFEITSSNIELHFEYNSTLIASPDWKNWPLTKNSTDHNGSYVPLISNSDNAINNILITGNGTIFGNGQIWWTLFKNNTLIYYRPYLIFMYNVESLIISHIKLIDGPSYHIVARQCNNVEIFNINVTISNPGYSNSPNTDGINIGSSNVHIYNNWILNGDDSLVLKTCAFNVLIENSTTLYGLGINVGTGGNITNSTFRNIICYKTGYGIRLKAYGPNQKKPEQYGNQSNIIFNNITFIDVGTAIDLNQFNHGITHNYKSLQWVNIDNIVFEDIYGTYHDAVGQLKCDDEYPCKQLSFSNINLTTTKGKNQWQCENVYGVATNIEPPLDCLN